MQTALFAFLLVAVVVGQYCPNDCNKPNGNCIGDSCICVGNWAGDDCSIYNQYLNSGEVAHSAVTSGQWRFYRHEVRNAGSTLTWWMNQTETETPDPWDEDPDGDLYVQVGTFPTLSNFLLRNVTLAKNNILRLENAPAGVYYAGVFGYSAVHYAISITESRDCPNNCHGHGTCAQGQCNCFPNFGGDECEYAYQRLTPASPLVGHVDQYNWNYFYTDVAQTGSQLLFTVAEITTGSASDCDLYVAFDRAPSLFDWDFANVTMGEVSTIFLSNAQAGQYTMGVYGYFDCSFRVTVLIHSPEEGNCPNDCSAHGDCQNQECACFPGFEGETCEWMEAPLALSRPQEGYVGKNAWNYYNARIITSTALVISVTQEGEGDCDLYVRADDKPTRFEFDYVDLSFKTTYSVVIREPGDHTWYMGVFGWEACSYTITLDEALVCACGFDNPHGDCHENYTECFCHEGWAGSDCSFQLTPLVSGEKTAASLKKFEWQYFELQVNESSTGVVSLHEKNSTGLLWLFVSFIEPPSINNYDLSEKETNTATHEIQISTPLPQTRTLYVGVYGNPYNTHPEVDLEFDLVAWAAPF